MDKETLPATGRRLPDGWRPDAVRFFIPLPPTANTGTYRKLSTRAGQETVSADAY